MLRITQFVLHYQSGTIMYKRSVVFFLACEYCFIMKVFFQDSSDVIVSKVYSIIERMVLTVADVVPSKYVPELTNCSIKSIFCISATIFVYQRRSHRYCDLWFLLSAGGRCIMPLSRSTLTYREAEKVHPLADSETDLLQLALINDACTVTSD